MGSDVGGGGRLPWYRIAIPWLLNEVKYFRPRTSLALFSIRLIPPLVCTRLRAAILRWGGVTIGPGSIFGGPITIEGYFGAKSVRVGSECVINRGAHFDATEMIEIGDRVAFGQDVIVLTGSHEVGDSSRRMGTMNQGPVTIGDGAWVGARSVILPGVTIGAGAVVAAAAVVTTDVAPDTLVGGVPARFIRTLD